MILCICQAHDFSAGKSNVLTVRLDSGMTSSLLTWRDMCDATCVLVHLRFSVDELPGNVKHLGVPVELSLHQAPNQHPGHAKAKLGTAEEGRLANGGPDFGNHPFFQRLSLAEFMSFA